MTAFASTPGTALVSLDATDPEFPIIGWLHTSGLNALPLVVGHPGPLVAGHGIQFANESVYDMMTGKLFDDAESWRDDFNDDPKYRIGTVIKEAVFSAPAPDARTPEPPAPKSGSLDFSGKVYQKASFWQAHTGGREVVFTLPPETPSPLPPAKKITRDTYFELRKTITESNVAILMAPAEDQPQLPFEGDDDDDDGNDLI